MPVDSEEQREIYFLTHIESNGCRLVGDEIRRLTQHHFEDFTIRLQNGKSQTGHSSGSIGELPQRSRF